MKKQTQKTYRNVKDLSDKISCLEGLAKNFRGTLVWNTVKLIIATSMVWGLTTGCSSRTATADDINPTQTAVAENYTPYPAAEFTPSVEPTKEDNIFPDGRRYPYQEAFAISQDKLTGSAEPLAANLDYIENIRKEAAKTFGGKVDIMAFDIITENGRRPYVLINIKKKIDDPGKDYTVFTIDENNQYHSVDYHGQITFLPMTTVVKGGIYAEGFEIKNGMLYPQSFFYQDNRLIFIDPVTLTQVEITSDSELVHKIVFGLVKPLTPEGTSVGQEITSDMVGNNGITKEMVGTKVTIEGNLPFRFLSNSEGKRIAVYKNGERGGYLDVKIPNLLETKDAKVSDVIRLTPEQVLDGTWANTITVETYRLGLDKQYIDPKYASYRINDHPEDEWSRSSLGFNYQELPPNVFEEIQNNKKLRPTLELYYAILHYPDGKEQILLSSKFLQKNILRPFNFFNMALYSSGGKFSNKDFIENIVKTNFLTHNAIPAASIDKNEAFVWKMIKSSGYYSNVWNLGYYGNDGNGGIAQEELKKLEKNGFASKKINRIIFLQGGSQDIFDNSEN